METIRKRWMWRRVMEKDLQDIPPGYPSEIFCLTKRSNPKSISWHFQSKQWTHSLKHTHTHTLLCICFSSRRSTFHPCEEVEGLCPEMSGQQLKICDACTQRESSNNPNRLNTLVVTEQQLYQRNNMFTCKAAPQTAFSNILITFTPNRVASLK